MALRFGIIFAAVLAFPAVSIVSGAEGNPVEAARREGIVIWYPSVGETQEIAKAFEKKYPFIKVEIFRSITYPLLNRILNEARAGMYRYDVVRQAAFPMNMLIQKGLAQHGGSCIKAAGTSANA